MILQFREDCQGWYRNFLNERSRIAGEYEILASNGPMRIDRRRFALQQREVVINDDPAFIDGGIAVLPLIDMGIA